jgi:mycothiol system anti-sigma-R factor
VGGLWASSEQPTTVGRKRAVGAVGEHDHSEGCGTGDRPEPPAGFVDCDETIERLYVYLDGELTDERRVQIARHLDLCGPCVRAYGFEAELRKVVASRCKDRVPESLVARVAAALAAEQTRQKG